MWLPNCLKPNCSDAGAGHEEANQVVHRPTGVEKGILGCVAGGVGHADHVAGGIDAIALAVGAAERAEVGRGAGVLQGA